MRPRLGILIGVVLVVALVVGTAAVAGAKPSGLDSLPAFSAAAEPLELVGDAGGLRLGVSIVSDTEAVAYLCDGASVGVWFSGTVDLESGAVNLKSDKGGTVTLSLESDPTVATVVVDGKTTPFTLAPVTGIGGVFRSVTKAKGHRFTTGWIVADDATIVGLTSDESGKTVDTVSSSSGGPPPAGTPTPPSVGTPPAAAPPSGGTPVADKAVRCAILAAEIRRHARLGNEAPPGSAERQKQFGFANSFGDRFDALGCQGLS
jgi:hypothetical protein